MAVFVFPEGVVIALADGAGGSGSGGLAANVVCGAAQEAVAGGACSGRDWVEWLADVDRRVQASSPGGETTGVIVEISRGEITGASVGDSGAAVIEEGTLHELTTDQCRKPLLGSGRSRPVGFGPRRMRGRLLVASDGLFKYVPHDAIIRAATSGPLEAAVDSLVAAARLRSGRLPDDVAVALCEHSG